MSLLSDKQIAGFSQIHDMSIVEEVNWDKLICMFVQSYCVKFACDYDEARDKTDNLGSQTLWELMCFKQLQLCYGTSVHETIMIHLVDKSHFILSDHKTRSKSLQ